jgi:DNA polymerase-1
MPTLTLIDGSGFVFRAYHAIPHLSTTKGVPTNAVYGFTTMLLKALREHAPTHVALVFDAGRRTFRHEIDPGYKASRPEAPDDLKVQFPLVREVARALSVPIVEEEGVEADDVIGTLACRARERGWDVVVVTGDKDFAQLVDGKVSLYDPMAEASGRGGRTGPEEVERKLGIRPDQVVEYMALLGDKIDDVPGIPGVGEVTAAALVRHFGSVEEMLRRPDEIPKAVARGGEKLRERIVANAERIRTNRRLVALRCDLVLPFEPDAFGRRPPDDARARALFSELEFSRLLKELPAPPPAARAEKAEVVLDAEALAGAVRALRDAPAVALRPVLAGPAPRTDPAVGLALAGGGRAFYVPLAHRFLGAPAQLPAAAVAEALRPILEGEGGRPVHAHDRKAAMHALARLGLALRAPGLDTELASRLLLPTRREHALADVARERIGSELPRDPGGGDAARRSDRVALEGLEPERVGAWAAAGAAAILELAPALERALAEEGVARLHAEIEAPLVPVLFEMERAGILVDKGAMAGLSEEFGRAMQDLEARIHASAGHPFNVASTRELAQVLFTELELPILKRLKTGPSTDQDVLEKLAEQHELPRLVLEHRSLSKLKGTYVDALPLLVDPADGRIHTTFHQAGAATGRLSSSDPNLQNIPVRTELSRRIRAAFVAPPGRRLLSADYSQIELRILAHYSDDPALVEAFRTHEDVHTRTAAETYGVAPADVTPEMRRVAKMLNFGIAYGLSAFGLAQRLDLPDAEARKIIERYFTRYAGVKRYIDQAIEEARRHGESRTLYGRVRAMPEIAARNPGLRMAAERTAINTPIQGTAADIVKVAMLRVHAALEREGRDARLLLQVHDELVLEVGERDLAAVEELVKREMVGAATLKVPLEVEAGHGRSWAEAH